MIATAPKPHVIALTATPPWPLCYNCREWRAGGCGYRPRSRHPWHKPPAGGRPVSLCGYWHSPEGLTLREHCKALCDALSRTRPPVPHPNERLELCP